MGRPKKPRGVGRPKKERRCRECRKVCKCSRKQKHQPRAEPLWRLLDELGRLQIDREDRPWGQQWRVWAGAYDADGRRVEHVAPRLQEAVYLALGRPLERRCLGACGRVLPLNMFNINNKYPSDGIDVRCRICESMRKKGARTKRKKRRQPGKELSPEQSAAQRAVTPDGYNRGPCQFPPK